MRAFLMLRADPVYRRESAAAGLEALGYQVHGDLRGSPARSDVVVIWNRYGRYDTIARNAEAAGARVLVMENGIHGRDRPGGPWYSLALGNVPGPGAYQRGTLERWRSFRLPLLPWRNGGREILILAQRGIGSPGHASPPGWHHRIAAELALRHPGVGVRVRAHPGERTCEPLAADLVNARCVVTWASNAAVRAVTFGVPAFFACPTAAGRRLGSVYTPALEGAWLGDREGELALLSGAEWTANEIATGLPFRRLLEV